MLAVPDLCHFNWRFNNSNQGEKRSEWPFNNREFLEKGLLFYLYAAASDCFNNHDALH